jgi:hypothetical protein
MPISKSTTQLLILCVILVFVSCKHANDQEEITKSFLNYKAYMANNLGEKAVKLTDSNTINYFSELLYLVKNADSNTVERLRFDQKLSVLLTRHMATREKILNMDGRSLFIFIVQTSPGRNDDDNDEKLDLISISKNVARCQIIDSNAEKGLVLEFRKEYGVWKIDIPAMYAATNNVWKEEFKSTGRTEKELISTILMTKTDIPPDNSIWQPVK